jgi:hypothetical protein
MNTNKTRILTSILTTMTVFLLWLIAVVFKNSTPDGQIPRIAQGDLLVLTILFIPTITLAGNIIIRMVPILFENPIPSRIGH